MKIINLIDLRLDSSNLLMKNLMFAAWILLVSSKAFDLHLLISSSVKRNDSLLQALESFVHCFPLGGLVSEYASDSDASDREKEPSPLVKSGKSDEKLSSEQAKSKSSSKDKERSSSSHSRRHNHRSESSNRSKIWPWFSLQ